MEKAVLKKNKIYETLKSLDLNSNVFRLQRELLVCLVLSSHGIPILPAKLTLLKCSEATQRAVQHFKLISRQLGKQRTRDWIASCSTDGTKGRLLLH